MGVVYRAYDPELNRRVALKLLHQEVVGETQRLRFVREAQAMAKLSHPHVATVFDVGTHRGRGYIAMEYVEGPPLSTWLQQRERSWPEVVQLFRQAGRGLEAAHDKGLVHRDFKPDNVIVDTTVEPPRAVVTDFGVARSTGDIPSEVEDLEASNEASLASQSKLTVAGAVLGTPAYMAPEQFNEQPSDAAADQFSFCVSLWEALYGERPFAGEGLQLATNVATGRRRPVPAGRRVPRVIRAALDRGLSTDPADRWPSMDDLLRELTRNVWWRRLALAVPLTAAVVSAGVLAVHAREKASQLAACEDRSARSAEVWNDERKEALRASLLRKSEVLGPEAFDKSVPWLDRWRDEWTETSMEVCSAGIEGSFPRASLQSSYFCLDAALHQVDGKIDALINGVALASQAASAASNLRPTSQCRDPEYTSRLPPPPTGADAADIAEISRRRGVADTYYDLGQYAAAEREARAALAPAEALEWKPAIWATNLDLGGTLVRTAREEEAYALIESVYFEAALLANDEIMARAASMLVLVAGGHLERFHEADVWYQLAQVSLAEDDLPRRLHLESARAQRLGAQGRTDETVAARESLLEHNVQFYGTRHPMTARAHSNLGLIYNRVGRFEEAVEHTTMAVRIYEPTIGTNHPLVASAHNNLGSQFKGQGRLEDAKRAYERAVAIEVANSNTPTLRTAMYRANLAGTLRMMGSIEEAETAYRRSMQEFLTVRDPDHPNLDLVRRDLAMTLRMLGRDSEAQDLYTELLQIQRRRWGDEHPGLATTHLHLADANLDAGRLETALEHAEQGWKSVEDPRMREYDRAVLTGHLARLRFETGRADAEGVRDLVDRARASYEALGPGMEEPRENFEAWAAEVGL